MIASTPGRVAVKWLLLSADK